jgi:hypothetical protein
MTLVTVTHSDGKKVKYDGEFRFNGDKRYLMFIDWKVRPPKKTIVPFENIRSYEFIEGCP